MSIYRVKSLHCVLMSVLLAAVQIVHAGEISSIDDMYMGLWSPFAARWQKSVPICVWSVDSETHYQVIASGHSPGNFHLGNELGDTVNYDVFWETGRKFRKSEALLPDQVSNKRFKFSDTSNCSNQPNAQLRVVIDKADLDSATPAVYQDTLLILLSPI